MRLFVAVLLVSYFGAFAIFLGTNAPDNPRSFKDQIGVHFSDWLHISGSPMAEEAILLVAVLILPTLMALSMVVAADANAKLRAQIARMGAVEETARTAVDKAHGALCGAKIGVRELTGDALEQRLLTVSTDHGNIARSLEQIERDHLERMSRMGDRAQILTRQIATTRERLTAVATGESSISETVSRIEAAKRELDENLKNNEGEADLAERLAEAERGMDGFGPRITALEELKPKVIAARDAFAALAKRLAEADGDETRTLRDIIEKLKTDTGSFEEEELVVAETDEDGNSLEDAFNELGTLADFTERIDKLAALTKQVLAEKAEFDKLRARLDAADGDEEHHLYEIVATLKADYEKLEGDLAEAETDEDDNSLDDAFSELDDLSDFEDRIKALEDLAPKIGPLKAALMGLKTRVGQLENISIAKEIEKLDTLREKIETMLGELEDEVPEDALDELVSAESDFRSRIDALKASVAGT